MHFAMLRHLLALGVSVATGICSSCASRHADSIVCGWRPRVLRVFRQESCGVGFFSPEGGIASQTDSLRRSEEHTSELQSQSNLVCRLLLEKKKIYFQIRCYRSASFVHDLLYIRTVYACYH